MSTEIRVALLGGTAALRSARREILATNSNLKVVFDSDGFAVTPEQLIEVNFDVLIAELRLDGSSALDYLKAMHTLAKVQGKGFGRVLIASQFSDEKLRLQAIQAGALDAVFVSEGMAALISKIENCLDEYSDYAIRELITQIPKPEVSQAEFQAVAIALDTLDEREAKIVKAFCELKTDAQISSAVHVPKLKVRQTLTKVQNLLQLDTRSQLLLKMFSLGALAL